MDAEERLTEGIEALGIESSVARGIAELTCDVQRKRHRAACSADFVEDRFQARCWMLLFCLLHRLAGDEPDWNAWGSAHAESRRMVEERIVAERRTKELSS
ncbi:MAG: hypothetical protein ACOX9R_08330 [Armatimonadota bacterium]|jgi:hypothetical protein